MAESNAAVQLTPEDLDNIEDALELCEADDFTAPSTMSEAAVTRLSEYRDILAMSREALTLEDVPEGLLDGVLAEAAKTQPERPVVAPKPEGFWSRLRKSFVLPSFAVVATAVAVLMLVQPDDAQQLDAVAPAPVHQAEATKSKSVEQSATQMPGAAAAADKREDDAPADEPEADAEEELAKEAEAGDYGAAQQRASGGMANTMHAPPPARAKRSPSQTKADAAPAPAEQKQQAPALMLDKEELIPMLEQADNYRRQDVCPKAIPLYEQILPDSGYYGGRAAAGLGLCAYRKGNQKSAEAYFLQARGKSGSVQSWIDTELEKFERSLLNEKSKRRKSKKSSNKQSKADPFDAQAL